MAGAAIDTAIRGLVALGISPDEIALLDNFCWCSSDEPERLWQLKQAAKGCYDYAKAFGTPFISGKDSMFNDFSGYDAENNRVKVSVPPTLLISSIGVHADVVKAVSIDAKIAGDLVYVIGETAEELGGSEYFAHLGYTGNTVPSARRGSGKGAVPESPQRDFPRTGGIGISGQPWGAWRRSCKSGSCRPARNGSHDPVCPAPGLFPLLGVAGPVRGDGCTGSTSVSSSGSWVPMQCCSEKPAAAGCGSRAGRFFLNRKYQNLKRRTRRRLGGSDMAILRPADGGKPGHGADPGKSPRS